MIKRKGAFRLELKEKMRGGEGTIKIEHLWDQKTELKANTRLFARLLIEPGGGIGFHQHENEEEVFVIIRGQAEADDNGKKVILNPGDTILTGNGAGHAIKCVGPDSLEMLAVISCYEK